MFLAKKYGLFSVLLVAFIVVIAPACWFIIISIGNSEAPKFGGAVVTNGLECSEISTNILKKGGSAVDAAIAALFCDGLTCPQSTGLGESKITIKFLSNDLRIKSVLRNEPLWKALQTERFCSSEIPEFLGRCKAPKACQDKKQSSLQFNCFYWSPNPSIVIFKDLTTSINHQEFKERIFVGGGFFMTIYSKETGKVETLNARETAPKRATRDMFVGKPGASIHGGLAVAVPSELKGYWEAYKRYGKLEWEELVKPTIELCRKGHLVTKYLAGLLKTRRELIFREPSMREIFINPTTNQTWREGDRIQRHRLAGSLEIIAKEGGDALYSRNGSLMKDFVEDIQSFGGIITEEDLIEYKVEWNEPETSKLRNGDTLYTMPLPGSGPVLMFIMNLMEEFDDFQDNPLTWHRVVESFKFAYAERSKLGDPSFVPEVAEILKSLRNSTYVKYIRSRIDDTRTFNTYEHYGANFSFKEDHGTAHISVLAPNGDAVAVTGTINLVFGAMIRSSKVGIILNDEMDDFSTPGTVNEYGVPASPANYIEPGKRPMSSMAPTIVVDSNGWPKLIVGSAGGTKITTSTALVILRMLKLNSTIQDAIDAKRFHHQLAPMRIQHEKDFDSVLLQEFIKLQHVLQEIPPDFGFASATGISVHNGDISAAVDSRRGGSVSIIHIDNLLDGTFQ